MDEIKVKTDPFNPLPSGKQVNAHVHRVERQQQPDFSAIQKSLEETAQVAEPKKE